MPTDKVAPLSEDRCERRLKRQNAKMKGPMTENPLPSRTHQRWAHFRFGVIGQLLAAPPARGGLVEEIRKLAERAWSHPITGQPLRLGAKTIERWYYAARADRKDPVGALRRKIRADHGHHPSLGAKLREALIAQHREHPSWSYQLHADNLAALIQADPSLGQLPSYATIVRYMKAHALLKRPRRGPPHSPGAQRAEERYTAREVRSYESEYVNALWHLDFHHGTRRVLLPGGRWAYPLLFGVLDDCTRLCCHVQWYLAESACDLCHGLTQALQKRQLPRALMSDNGSAMLAAETTGGLARLGILHQTTLPYSPYQNGKQESFWGQIEGRLLPMLESVKDLTLKQLNQATQAWAEVEYNRKVHSETRQTPLQAYLEKRDLGRPVPSAEDLRLAFTAEALRTQRRSDGTVSLEGVRFEIPSRYGHLPRLCLRYAGWDLSQVHLADPKTGAILCRVYPLDKHKNAGARRAARQTPIPPDQAGGTARPSGEMAPLLKDILSRYAATGLPPAYLPKDEIEPTTGHTNS